MRNHHFLTTIFSLDVFSEQELDLIISKFNTVRFNKSTFLLQQGKTAQSYWFLESGMIRSFVLNNEDQDISTNFYISGDIVIDWQSFFLRVPARENIQALTDVVCWQLEYDYFQQLFNGIQAFRELGRHRLVCSYFELKEKSISMIADPAIERYRKLIKDKPHLVQQIPLKLIATYLGVTDTSLSRIRKQLSKE